MGGGWGGGEGEKRGEGRADHRGGGNDDEGARPVAWWVCGGWDWDWDWDWGSGLGIIKKKQNNRGIYHVIGTRYATNGCVCTIG